MPKYQYRCPDCGDFDRILRVADHVRVIECECGKEANQVITAPMLVIPAHMSATGISAYESPVTGELITTQRQRKEDMARHGCIEYDPGMRQDVDRRVIEEEKALDKAVDETFDRALAELPAVKREKLDAEMSAGVTAETVRL